MFVFAIEFNKILRRVGRGALPDAPQASFVGSYGLRPGALVDCVSAVFVLRMGIIRNFGRVCQKMQL